MQIIQGKYKARKLITLQSDGTRPTLARVKESLFSMIDDYIYSKNVLDLFAGSGALGIECISRGANKVVFVDNSKDAIKVINKNLERIKEDFLVVCDDYISALKQFSLKNYKFDLVFLDPPFSSDFGDKAIKLLYDLNLLSCGAIIVYEQDCKKCLHSAPEMFIIKKSRKYGLINLTILEYIGE